MGIFLCYNKNMLAITVLRLAWLLNLMILYPRVAKVVRLSADVKWPKKFMRRLFAILQICKFKSVHDLYRSLWTAVKTEEAIFLNLVYLSIASTLGSTVPLSSTSQYNMQYVICHVILHFWLVVALRPGRAAI